MSAHKCKCLHLFWHFYSTCLHLCFSTEFQTGCRMDSTPYPILFILFHQLDWKSLDSACALLPKVSSTGRWDESNSLLISLVLKKTSWTNVWVIALEKMFHGVRYSGFSPISVPLMNPRYLSHFFGGILWHLEIKCWNGF